jgi:hypothetical protein
MLTAYRFKNGWTPLARHDPGRFDTFTTFEKNLSRVTVHDSGKEAREGIPMYLQRSTVHSIEYRDKSQSAR